MKKIVKRQATTEVCGEFLFFCGFEEGGGVMVVKVCCVCGCCGGGYVVFVAGCVYRGCYGSDCDDIGKVCATHIHNNTHHSHP